MKLLPLTFDTDYFTIFAQGTEQLCHVYTFVQIGSF